MRKNNSQNIVTTHYKVFLGIFFAVKQCSKIQTVGFSLRYMIRLSIFVANFILELDIKDIFFGTNIDIISKTIRNFKKYDENEMSKETPFSGDFYDGIHCNWILSRI